MEHTKRGLDGRRRVSKPHLEKLKSDKSAQLQAEKTLKAAKQRYQAIFEQAPDSLVLIDAETGAFVEFNDRAHKCLGYSREEFGNLKLSDFEVIESAEQVARHIKKIIREVVG